MTKSDLIELLAERSPLFTSADTTTSVNLILEAISTALVKGGRVEIRGFGSFSLNYRPPRIGRNPKSGERVEITAKYVPHFKPGKEMRELVDTTAQAEAPIRKIA